MEEKHEDRQDSVSSGGHKYITKKIPQFFFFTVVTFSSVSTFSVFWFARNKTSHSFKITGSLNLWMGVVKASLNAWFELNVYKNRFGTF